MFSKRKGFTLVEIMIVVAIIALLAAIAIPNLLRSRLNSAEANAQATLKTISTAFESYAAANGDYEITVADLADETPPYLNEDYTDADEQPIQGYEFTCPTDDDASAYICSAEPQGAFADEGRAFTICTGGVTPDPSAAGEAAPACP
ncbi:MAG: prepilin-type N-terminal cleavage/methylation domain-containing protein [Candidatus Omnitrophota bacterium]